MEKEFKHYGMLEKSGRYPWGSGENPYQRLTDFRSTVFKLRKQGVPYTEIAKGMGIKTTQLRARLSIASSEIRAADVARAEGLRAKGHSPTAIGKIMGKPESSIRSLLDPGIKARGNITKTTADMLADNVDKNKYVDVGIGVERHMGISKGRLATAVAMLEEQGYKIQYVDVEQIGSKGNYTTVKVLVHEDTPYKELWDNQDKIKSVVNYSEDGGRSYRGLEPIKSVDSSRVKIVYSEEGGADKDGVLELRPGVPDLDLGEARYAQVRVGVDGKYYMKGMAIRNDGLPKGIDILYHTTKPKGTPPEKVFKTVEDDEANPFGSTVRQKHYIDKNGKEQLSALNIMGDKEGAGEEGHWNEWSKTISSQVLSKQDPKLAQRQLDMFYKDSTETLDEIKGLNNAVIRKHLMMKQADQYDADAAHLKAAALPRQRNQIILPVPSLKDTEVYAPNYRPGESVVLIRHPHGGRFEMPVLTVNNKNPEAKKYLGNSQDAIGINPKVAQQLSGADFDGDTVIVIPNTKRAGIKTSPPLKELENFDPSIAYPYTEGMVEMKEKSKGRFMGDASNLITDMTIKGASDAEIARAVKHSMVVIDAPKHRLNYQESYKQNGIRQLKQKYQGASNAGASTIVSRAKSPIRVPLRSNAYTIDKKTGAKVYKETPEVYVNKAGKTVERTTQSRAMDETTDAYTLSSGTPMENIYADFANKHKALANAARKEAIAIKPKAYNASAKKVYEDEVASLNAKLNVTLMNKPVERYAQLITNSIVRTKRQDNPNLTADEVKKMEQQTLEETRRRVGAERQVIDNLTAKEWEAIQAGAISPSKLTQIIENMEDKVLKELSMPREKTGPTPNQISRIKSMLASGYTQSDIADALGVSTSVVNNYV